MKRILFAAVCIIFAAPALAAVSEQEAITIVFKTIVQKKPTSLAAECLEVITLDQDWTFTVREKHNEHCGGDPETAPRLFDISVNRKTGAAKIIQDESWYR